MESCWRLSVYNTLIVLHFNIPVMIHLKRLSIRSLLLASVFILSSFTASHARHFNASQPDTIICVIGDSAYGLTILESTINDSLTVYASISGMDAAYFSPTSPSVLIPADSLYSGIGI